MNNSAMYRVQFLLRNQELLIAYSQRIKSLSFTLALRNVEEEKDGLDPEERRSDENEELIYREADQFARLLPKRTDGNTRKDFLLNSEVLTESNINDVLSVLAYKEEQQDIYGSPFSPLDLSKESITDAYIEFLIRLLSCYRVKARSDSIQEGILEYGVEPFIVPEDEVPFSVLDGIYNRNEEERQKELSVYLNSPSSDEDDDGEEKAAKKSIQAILSYFQSNKKEKKK